MYTAKQEKLPQSRVLQNSKSLRCIALQRNTIVFEQKGQTYDWLYGRTQVGKIVRVGLDPDNMIQGQSANLNVAQDAMMCQIRKFWGIKGGNIVKGHLWNDNLGGSAFPSRRICYPPGMSVRVSDPIGYKGLQTPASTPSDFKSDGTFGLLEELW